MKQARMLILLTLFASYCKGQDLTTGRWKIKSSAIIVRTDTAYLFKNNATTNLYKLSKIAYQFNGNNTYSGVAIDGTTIINGQWKRMPDKIEIDSATSTFQFINSTEFVISSPFTIMDTLGITAPATSLLRFYNSPISDFHLTVFPNPFSNLIQVQMESPKKFEATIEVRNVLGQKVYILPAKEFDTQAAVVIDLGNFSNGIYFLTLTGANLSESRKIIKI